MSSISPGLPTPSSSFVWKNITVDDTDSSLKYSQGWNRSESSAAHGGSFLAADGVGNHVSFSLPANAVSVYYFGFKQSLGAFYDACLDCHTEGTVDAIDGHSDEPRSSEPTLLYYKTNLDPSIQHTLDLVNMADARFEDSSTITVDSFVVTILGEELVSSTSTSSVTHSTSSSESATMSSMNIMSLMAMDPTNVGVEDSPSQPSETPFSPSASSSTASAQVSASGPDRTQNQNNLSSAEDSARKLRSPLLLTGLILAILFVVCTLLYALMYFMRRRKRRRTAPVLGEGHWAARFFGEKGRGSIWIGNVGRLGAGGAKVAKGAMIEQLVPDKRLHASLPSGPSMRASLPPRHTTSQWIAPAYDPYNTSHAAVSTRTIPRSAFPSSSPSTNLPGLPMQNWQVARNRSASVGTNPMYTRAPSRTPSAGSTYSQVQRPMMPSEYGDAVNPYVAEARARVRDRARGTNDGGLSGPAIADANPYSYGYGNGVDNAYGQPGAPGHGYGYGPSGAGVIREDSWGRRYGP